LAPNLIAIEDPELVHPLLPCLPQCQVLRHHRKGTANGSHIGSAAFRPAPSLPLSAGRASTACPGTRASPLHCEGVRLPVLSRRQNEKLEQWAEIPNQVTVFTYTVLYRDLDQKPLEEPAIMAYVKKLENAGGGLAHYLGDVELKAVYIGMGVETVFKDVAERTGTIPDILHFRPRADEGSGRVADTWQQPRLDLQAHESRGCRRQEGEGYAYSYPPQHSKKVHERKNLLHSGGRRRTSQGGSYGDNP